MTLKVSIFAATGILCLSVSSFAAAAPIVTFTQSTMVRSQVQGAGTYQVLDLFYSNSPGAEFLGYEIDVRTTSGFLYDPARGQDDRQVNPIPVDPTFQEGETRGAVDTWVNTVMTSAARIDFGYSASILANPVGYLASGGSTTIPAPGFTRLNWVVDDSQVEDDNDLNDHPADGPIAATAPYHIARIVADPTATGTIRFETSDTLNPATTSVFNFTFSDGDYNFNGVVDAADYVVWRKLDGTEGGYDLWRTNFGVVTLGQEPALSFPNGAPEPASSVLLSFGVFTIGMFLRRRSG